VRAQDVQAFGTTSTASSTASPGHQRRAIPCPCGGCLPLAVATRCANEHPRRGALAAAFFLLAGVGAWVHRRRDRTGFAYFAPLMVSMTLVLIYYLNFRYGASQAGAADVPREVRDRDYFYLWSFSAWGVWAGIGLVWTWRSIAQLLGGATACPRAGKSPAALVPLVATGPLRRHDLTTVSLARPAQLGRAVGVLSRRETTTPFRSGTSRGGGDPQGCDGAALAMNTDWFARGIIRRRSCMMRRRGSSTAGATGRSRPARRCS
jgi:hypothetical protein